MKDPAFLFYPGDWLGGTMTFTRSHKGAYMDLLMAQHSTGHMSLDDIKTVLGNDFVTMWESKLKAKFLQDSEGKFYNQKLENEILKRKKFTESRRDNLEKQKRDIDNHMKPHMENGNGDESLIDIPFKSITFLEKWKEYTKFRSENGFPKYKPTGLKNHFSRLINICGGDEQTAIAIYDQAMANNYQGIFPLKADKKFSKPEKSDEQKKVDEIAYQGMTPEQIIDKKRRDAGIIK